MFFFAGAIAAIAALRLGQSLCNSNQLDGVYKLELQGSQVESVLSEYATDQTCTT